MTDKKKYILGPCKDCGSSDACATYEDHTYCYSCMTWNPLKPKKPEPVPPPSFSSTYSFVEHRGIPQSVFEKFTVRTRSGPQGPEAVLFPFGSSVQVRGFGNKQISTQGDSSNVRLFGQDIFSSGEARAITITEGPYDAMAAYWMLGAKYPVVSVRSAATARRDCERHRDYLNSFDKIYLCLDSDEHGQRAARDIALLFDINKVFYVNLSQFKDANEYLQNGKTEEFSKIWWNSKKFKPKGIVSEYSDIEKILSKEDSQAIATYPFASLNSMTYGIRSGELILFTALEKVGKTEILRAIEYELLAKTDYNLGIIHLEEQEKRSIQGLVGYHLKSPVHLPGAGVSLKDQVNAYKDITKHDGRVHFYSHFGSDDPDTIIDVIRSLVSVCHCKFVFLDHITMLVTGFEDEDERKKLDYISTRLAMLTRELDFTLFMVSHVNDNGQTRGSRNIAKVADLIIHLDRSIESSNTIERNTTRLTCRGNRYSGLTGPAGELLFDSASYTLSEPKITIEESFDYSVE